jgi:hypothetical protein
MYNCRRLSLLVLIHVRDKGKRLINNIRSNSSKNFEGWYKKEALDENHRLQLSIFLNELYEENLYNTTTTTTTTTTSSSSSSSIQLQDKPSIYKKFNDKLNANNFNHFLDECLNNNTIVDEELLHETIVRSEKLFHDRPNVTLIPSSLDTIIVVGDLHGDLSSLAYIFKKYGLPRTEKAYIFNGDMIDRGLRSTEVLYFILNLHQQYPNSVFINRGNHEDITLNLSYGFCNELSMKYSLTVGEIIKEALNRFYVSIPLCCWIPDKKIFISHAGIPITSTFINNIKKNDNDINTVNRRLCKRTLKSNEILENMLWSDPDQSQPGISKNTSRGAGLYLGIDKIEQWMKNYDITTFIRSHQCVQFGYELLALEDPSKKVITVFSSANYRQSGNDGAVIILSKKGIDPHQYNTDDMIKDQMITLDSDPHCHRNYSEDVIRAIFKTLDKEKHGYLTIQDLEIGLKNAKLFKLFHNLDHSCIVGDRLLNIQDVFNEIDKDHNNKVNVEEFIKAFLSS